MEGPALEPQSRGEKTNNFLNEAPRRSFGLAGMWRAVKERGSPARCVHPMFRRRCVAIDGADCLELQCGGGAPFDPHVPVPQHWMVRLTRESPSPSLRARMSVKTRVRLGASFRTHPHRFLINESCVRCEGLLVI